MIRLRSLPDDQVEPEEAEHSIYRYDRDYNGEVVAEAKLEGDDHQLQDAFYTVTQVVDGTFAKVLAWYDNEMGYATRVADLCVLMGR